MVDSCPISLLPATSNPQLSSVPWVVEGDSEDTQKFILDNEGFLIYSDNIANLINFGRDQKAQVLYYTTSIEECRTDEDELRDDDG